MDSRRATVLNNNINKMKSIIERKLSTLMSSNNLSQSQNDEVEKLNNILIKLNTNKEAIHNKRINNAAKTLQKHYRMNKTRRNTHNNSTQLDECPICYNNISRPTQWNGCGHRFCASCIDEWKNTTARNPGCPMCRMGQEGGRNYRRLLRKSNRKNKSRKSNRKNKSRKSNRKNKSRKSNRKNKSRNNIK